VRGLFGADYAAGGSALMVLVWGASFAATGTLVLHGLVAAGLQRLLLITNLGATAMAVALQLVLVPRFQLIGSAAATVTALGVGQLLLALFRVSRPAVAASWRAALPAVALALATQILVVWARLPEPWPGLAGAALYAVGAYLIGLLRIDDLAMLVRAASRGAER
jgi:O-antigen/teichoic acid export membrane protein